MLTTIEEFVLGRIDKLPSPGHEQKQTQLKVVAERGNILTGYAAVWKDINGQEYIDNYNDVTCAGSWKNTIEHAKGEKARTGRDYLMPHLFNHHADMQIGGVKHLSEDGNGVIYETKLAMGLTKAQEVYDLAREGMIGVSYGYQATKATIKGGHRYLLEVDVIEITSTPFPANPLTTAHVKTGYADDVYGEMWQELEDMREELKILQYGTGERRNTTDQRVLALMDKWQPYIDRLEARQQRQRY